MRVVKRNIIQGYSIRNNKSNKMDDQFTYEEDRDDSLPVGKALSLLMAGKLTYIGELQEMFGYSDYRALEKWLTDNKITLLKLGRKKYAVSLMIDAFIQKEIKRGLDKSYEDSYSMMEAIENDDLDYLIKLTDQEAKQNSITKKNKRSKGSQRFADRLNDVE
jgi:hypothetical protein